MGPRLGAYITPLCVHCTTIHVIKEDKCRADNKASLCAVVSRKNVSDLGK